MKVLIDANIIIGKLYKHSAEIDTSACDMAESLIKEMARKQGVTEELKATDMMRWIGLIITFVPMQMRLYWMILCTRI